MSGVADLLTGRDGLGLAALVRSREVSASELLDAAIARVEARNPELNAVVSRLCDQARAAIAAGLPDGPFTGVPYLLKDLGAHCAGAVASHGSALFKDFVVDHDSELTARLNSAGNPAMSVPLGWSREGLPIGVQLVAPFGDEAALFRLGSQLEAAQPWGHRRSPA
jgi:Asp-tRNA(Asn)/Glu-tRNA(Gln) amidotransferase A subunit family amidase